MRSLFDRSRPHMGYGTGRHGQDQGREGRESEMWMIAIRAATLLGIGAAVGSTVTSAPVVQHVPQPIIREATSLISPFLIISVGIVIFAGGYFVWAWRRERLSVMAAEESIGKVASMCVSALWVGSSYPFPQPWKCCTLDSPMRWWVACGNKEVTCNYVHRPVLRRAWGNPRGGDYLSGCCFPSPCTCTCTHLRPVC